MSPALLYGRILPGAAVSLLVGNCFYAWQAQAPGGAHGPHRRLRPALRHQHRVALRARLPDHAARQARRRGRGCRRSRTRRLAGGAGRLLRVRTHRAGAGACGAERGPARDATRRACCRRSRASRSGSSRSDFFFRDVRAADRRTDDAGHRDADVLRPCAASRRSARRAGCGGGRHPARVADGHRTGGRRRRSPPVCTCPSPCWATCSPASTARHLLAYLSVILADGSLQRPRLAAEHRERPKPPATRIRPRRRSP